MSSKASYTVLETVRQRIATIELWSNKIIYIKFDDNEEVLLEDSIAQLVYLKSKFDGKNKHLILVEPGEFTTLSSEARDFSAKPENNQITLANAVVVKSLAHRLIINFIINFTQKQSMKMRIFETREKAIDWLLSFPQ